ncbi:MAG: cobalamin-independent methionine synthase II family protein [Chloroflexi bacterium]|nr:cobalamin-independent methionine synthase II family protein [Chloroflexota bacterium]MBV9602581.1 cobalamin-independent methionine synthase II family protein [Chloroflexota bacterium]
MKSSEQRVLTTHCGSLPRTERLVELLAARDSNQRVDATELAGTIRSCVDNVVQRQAAIGLDVIGDGEQSKSSFSSYVAQRLGGLTPLNVQSGFRGETRDTLQFADVYAEQKAMYAARPSNMRRPGGTGGVRIAYACTGPITYIGQDRVQEDVNNLRNALKEVQVEEAFITALSPSNVALYHRNEFYSTEEEYLVAIADAMHVEYQAIVDAGFILQIDDPRLATHYDRHPDISVEECRGFIAQCVEVINHALRGIPEDRVRFHTCYSTNVAPRVHDLELRHFVDLMLNIHAQAYSFEASNPRHEHEWQVWETAALPADKILVPGVVSHCITLVEHPDLVAQRIARFAGVVGRERVIASNDCGFATAGAGDEVHADVAWAKLEALTEGARRASQRLWP